MGEVSTIGLDIAKNLFQIHGVDADGTVVIRKRIGRVRVLEFFADLPPCRRCDRSTRIGQEFDVPDTWRSKYSHALTSSHRRHSVSTNRGGSTDNGDK
jgi:hypothetical protein